MAAYKTGRARTITISGEAKGEAWLALPLVGCAYSIMVEAYWLGVASPSLTRVYGKADYVSLDAIADAQYGPTDSDSDMWPMTTADNVATATWSMSIDVEEWVELTESSTAPTYGGSAVDGDVPGLASVRFFEKTRSGGSVTATISISDGTRSASATTTGTLPGEAELTSYTCLVTLTAGANLHAQAATVEWEYLFAEGPTYSASRSGISAASGADGANITITDSAGAHNGQIRVGLAPPRGWNLSGVLRADNHAYDGGGTVRVHRKWLEDYHEVAVSGGAWSYGYDQQAHGVSCTLDGYAQTSYSLYEWDDVYHWFVPPTGEQSDQWRLLLRGPYYLAGTVVQADTVVLDGGFSFGPGGTTRTFSPPKSLAGYRYLLVQTDQTDKQVTLTIGAKSWTVRTDGSGLARFDLCVPSNLNTPTDARDSRWPVPTDVDTVTGDGAMWGVVNVGSYTLAAEAGVTCAVGSNGVYLSRDTWASPPAGHSLLNVVSPHLYWVPSGPPGHYWRPFLRGDTDGKRSLEEADWFRNDNDLLNPYVPQTIKQLIDAVNAVDDGVVRNPGWQLIINPDIDVADGADGDNWFYGLLNKNRNAMWLEGGGISYRNGAWSYGLDLDVSSARDLYAQMLVDKVSIYPMCGDVFGLRTGAHRWEYGSTAEEGRAELRGGRFMRGVSWGVVAVGGEPRADVVVSLTELPGDTAAGSGTTDVRGEYLTGSPCGRAGYTHRTLAFGITYDYDMYSATRRRVCFAVPTTTNWLSLDCNAIGLHARAYEDGGKIVIGVSHGVRQPTFVDLKTDLDGEHPRVRWDNRLAHMPLIVAFERDGTCYTTRTSDCGRTFDLAITLGSGKYPVALVTPDGRYFHYWWQSGSIKVVISDYKGSVLHGPVTAIASADEDVFDVDQTVIHRNTWLAVIQYRSGGNIVTATSEDGVHFT